MLPVPVQLRVRGNTPLSMHCHPQCVPVSNKSTVTSISPHLVALPAPVLATVRAAHLVAPFIFHSRHATHWTRLAGRSNELEVHGLRLQIQVAHAILCCSATPPTAQNAHTLIQGDRDVSSSSSSSSRHKEGARRVSYQCGIRGVGGVRCRCSNEFEAHCLGLEVWISHAVFGCSTPPPPAQNAHAPQQQQQQQQAQEGCNKVSKRCQQSAKQVHAEAVMNSRLIAWAWRSQSRRRPSGVVHPPLPPPPPSRLLYTTRERSPRYPITVLSNNLRPVIGQRPL
jgi:hypothetical protein